MVMTIVLVIFIIFFLAAIIHTSILKRRGGFLDDLEKIYCDEYNKMRKDDPDRQKIFKEICRIQILRMQITEYRNIYIIIGAVVIAVFTIAVYLK